MKQVTRCCIYTLILLLFLCVGKHSASKKITITVAVASSLTLPLKRIAHQFEQQYKSRVELTFASSGVLTAQIIHGAPFDVFISANMVYPRQLDRLNKTAANPKVFTLGSLVLWSKTSINGYSPKKYLLLDDIQTVAIANPELAPFGEAATTWFRLKKIYQKVRPKLVYGENIGNVNRFIFSEVVDAALTSISALHAPQLGSKGHWHLLSPSETTGIPHGIALIKHGHSASKQAQLFLKYLFSNETQAILDEFGYIEPQPGEVQ